MRTFTLATILLGACASTNGKLPEGRVSYPPPHDDFATIRPTAIAVMKVAAPDSELAVGLRRALYDRLFEKNYSCLKLTVVDEHTHDGKLSPDSLEWDATFEVTLTGWRKYRGGRYFAATGHARMVHRLGEVLWECTFADYPLQAMVAAGDVDTEQTVIDLSKVIVNKDEFPPHPASAPE